MYFRNLACLHVFKSYQYELLKVDQLDLFTKSFFSIWLFSQERIKVCDTLLPRYIRQKYIQFIFNFFRSLLFGHNFV